MNRDITPKEKARELFDKYQLAGSQWYVDTTKKYALIAVDEILNYLTTSLDVQTSLNAINYWNEVKNEIEKL